MSIKLRNIIIDYGNSIAVDDLSLLIETGELVSLLGPSGCGKSTTLNAIAGLIQVTQGQIIFDGIDVTKKAPQKRNIGLVFQNYALYPHLSVFKNIAFPLYQNKNFKVDIQKNNALAKLEIAKIKHAGVEQKEISFHNQIWTILQKYVKDFTNNFQKIVNNDLKKIKKTADKYAVAIYGDTTLNAFRTRQFITWYDASRCFVEVERLDFYQKLIQNFDQILTQIETELTTNNLSGFENIKFLCQKEVQSLKIEEIKATKNKIQGINNAVKAHKKLMMEERKAAERLAKLSGKTLAWKVTKDQQEALKAEYENKNALWKTEFVANIQTLFTDEVIQNQLVATLLSTAKNYTAASNETKISQQELNEKIGFWNKQVKSFKKVVKSSVLDVAQKVEITSQLKKKPSELSGGQQQRVAIARAIVKKPKVLLLDEPLSNLDAKLRVSTREWIKKFQKETGITTIFVTHDQEEAMSISDKIFVMSQGVVQQADAPIAIYNNPANQFVANFIGTPSMNFFEGEIDARGTVIFGDTSLGKTTKKELLNQKIIIGVRPEHIELSGSNTKIVKANDKPLTAKIDLIERLGRSDYIKAVLPNKHEVRIIYDATNMELAPKTKEIEFNIMKNKVFLFETENNKRLLEVI